MSPQLNESSQLNVDSITDIHVTQSESNEMSHDYHAQNGLPDEVVGDFSDDEDKILANNNNNDNDDNDIQFLFQQTSTENVYRPYPNSANASDNQVLDNLNYRYFWTNNNNLTHTMTSCMLVSDSVNWRT